jgi:deoxyribonuclease IV
MFFGAHVSASGGVDKAMERAIERGADGVQLFIQSPRMWRPVNHKPAAVDRFRELREEHDIKGAVTHAIYLINIASPDDELREKSVAALEHTMQVAERLGLDAVIFHPGSHRSAQGGLGACIDDMARGMERVLEHSENTWLLMENCAGQGGTIGRDVDELGALYDKVEGHPRLGVCIDSCHWFASGVDVTAREKLDAGLAELDDAIGLDRLRALHINDSKTPLGSNRDRHANIGEGELADGLGTFLAHPKLQGLGAYLEVPGEGDGPTAEELTKVRDLHSRALAHA